MRKQRLLLSVLTLFLSLSLSAQRTVTGKVASAADRSPVAGASVVVEGSTRGTRTDGAGNFSLTAREGETLVISSVGFTAYRAPVGGNTTLTILLEPSSAELGNVVVVGYGTQKKQALTNAVSTIKGEQLTQRPVTNAQQALQGMAPGLTVQDAGGAPGRGSATLRVRGLTTLNNNNPLIIVDGVQQSFFDMNPEDIESVTVLKDATSTAIYGSSGANGVIVVTTKRAKSGKPVIAYNGYYALQKSINQPRMMDLEPYMQLQRMAYQNVGAAIPARYSEQSIRDWVGATDRYRYPMPNVWFEEVLRTAPQQSHTVSVSGGSDAFRARASMRYMDVDGIAPGFGNNIREVRLNTDMAASARLRFSTDLNYRYNYSETPVADVFNFMFHGSLWAVPKYPDGSYGLSPQGNNPLMYAEISGYNKQVTDRLFGSFKGEWDVVKNLLATVQFTHTLTGTQVKNFANAYTNRDSLTNITKVVANNALTENRVSDRETNLVSTLMYRNKWGQHHTQVMGGYQEVYTTGNSISAYRERFFNNDLQSLNAGTNDPTRNNGGADYGEGLRSFFGRFNYNFANKYFAEFAGRYDASSRFSSANQYAFFPSGSIGWRLSEESFFAPLKGVFSELKLRASHGVTGNNQISNYLFFPQLQGVTYTFGGNPVTGYRENILIDQDLTWEKNIQTDIGVDLAVLRGALTLTADWYTKRSKDILLNLPIPYTTGLAPGPQNAATVDNKGWEVSATYRGGREPGLRYELGGNASMNTNKVVDLANTGPYITGTDIDPRYITRVGLPYNAFWGYQTNGLLQSDAKAAASPYFQRPAKAGDVDFVDQNGDGKINGDDMVMIGNPFPKYTFALNQALQYRGFQLSLFWQGAADVDVRLSGALAEQGNYEGFTHTIYTDNYWTPDRPNARFPRPTKLDLRNQATTDRLVFDGSYLRLKNVQLAYSIPSLWVGRAGMSRATVYVSATNMLTFSGLNEWDLDPEVPSGRATYYPQTSLLSLGANITFK